MTEDGRPPETVLSSKQRIDEAAFRRVWERDAASTPPAPRIAQGASAGHAWRSRHGRATAGPRARVVSLQDVELAATVISDDDRIDGRYLQPALGTVEVRVMGAQTRVRDVPPVVAPIQSMARLELECEPSSVVPSVSCLPRTASWRLETGWSPAGRLGGTLSDSGATHARLPVGRLPPARARARLRPQARRGAAARSRTRRRMSAQIRRAHPPPR